VRLILKYYFKEGIFVKLILKYYVIDKDQA